MPTVYLRQGKEACVVTRNQELIARLMNEHFEIRSREVFELLQQRLELLNDMQPDKTLTATQFLAAYPEKPSGFIVNCGNEPVDKIMEVDGVITIYLKTGQVLTGNKSISMRSNIPSKVSGIDQTIDEIDKINAK